MSPAWMPSLVVLVPGDLDARTGGYGYDRRMVDGLRTRGWQVDVRLLDGSFPRPSPEARRHTARVLAEIPAGSLVLIDGLAFGAMAEEAARERDRLRIVALVHHPLSMETGITTEAARSLAASERDALTSARAAIVTSRATKAALADFGIPPERVIVVEPGTDRAPAAVGSDDAVCRLLCVASFSPRKGHDVLIDALGRLTGMSWHLTCAGDATRPDSTVDRLREQISGAGLSDRVTFAGDLNARELSACYARANVFVLPTFYEGYGMAVAEAVARGLPVISTPTGAIPDLVGTDAGILVPPGDSSALAKALSSVIADRAIRTRLSLGARQMAATLPTWDHAIDRMAAALEQVS